MTGYEIIRYAPVNDCDPDKVAEIAASIKANGWIGAPVLVCEAHCQMVTGSHRLAALQAIESEANEAIVNGDDDAYERLSAILERDCAEPVDEIIEAYCAETDSTIDDLPYDNLSLIFAGTEIEQYAAEIAEW